MSVEIKQLDNRKPLLYECFWETVDNKISLHSYAVNTKRFGQQNVLLLTTMQPIIGTTKDGGKKKTAVYKRRYQYNGPTHGQFKTKALDFDEQSGFNRV